MKKLFPVILIGLSLLIGTSAIQAQQASSQQDPLAIGLSSLDNAQTYRNQESNALDTHRAATEQNLFGQMTNDHAHTIADTRDEIMRARLNLDNGLRLFQSADHRFVHP